MIFDLRTYTLRTGSIPGFLALYEEQGLPVQSRHLGSPAGYFTTEVGELNQVVHLWKYQSMADREQRRAALEADPAWHAYRAHPDNAGVVLNQHNQILRSAPFSRL